MSCSRVAVAILLAVAGLAAAEAPADSAAEAGVPTHVVECGYALLRSSAGDEFVSQYVKFDPTTSQLLGGPGRAETTYRLWFRLVVPELGVDDSAITFRLDEEGSLLSPEHDLPDCLAHPEECELAVSPEDAASLAKASGLTGSPEGWEVDLLWRFQYGFVWQVVYERPSGVGAYYVEYKVVDAGTGKIVDGGSGFKTVCKI